MPTGLILTNVNVNMATKCIPCVRIHTAKMFCIHSLMVISLEDYTFWEQRFPDVKADAYFHVSVQKPAVLGTQSLTCRSVTMQCFHSVSNNPTSTRLFLPSHLSHHIYYLSVLQREQNADIFFQIFESKLCWHSWNYAWSLTSIVFFAVEQFQGMRTLLELHAPTTLSYVFTWGFVSDCYLSQHTQTRS